MITIRQIEVPAHNGKLKNPTARIHPIPIFTQGRGSQEPDPAYFPKCANQLYGLRKPQNERDYQMLAYLSTFYNIQQEAADASKSGEKNFVQGHGGLPTKILQPLRSETGTTAPTQAPDPIRWLPARNLWANLN
ncbi:hypothetical protein B0T25DRAFT_513852 [Lasiosphaeria hispida]|uniref:Uncharacterized protein n=1 Tax=Lasiosphaeria hispida TaxID=260671 RepID=A0AAJ0HWB1_9PEZI|nr:hypothetical protein B0T25DRAFT_513852 [Lasiosphaeria hispida]